MGHNWKTAQDNEDGIKHEWFWDTDTGAIVLFTDAAEWAWIFQATILIKEKWPHLICCRAHGISTFFGLLSANSRTIEKEKQKEEEKETEKRAETTPIERS